MDPVGLAEIGVRWSQAMRRGDFEAAWRETDRIEDARRAAETAGGVVRQTHHLVWNGTPFAGRRVLVRCTHGLGDTLQFVRYVPHLRAMARSVTLLAQPHLLPLFTGSDAFGNVRNGWTDEPAPPHDVEVEVMELPYAFRSTLETLPREVPYLPLAPAWRAAERLPHFDAAARLRVGLLWAASEWDASRSIAPAALAALAGVRDVAFYSLQQGAARRAWRSAPIRIEPLHRHTESIDALAAAILALDLVITVDGMVAHLAGALGRPVWVLLKHDADWRWMEGRADSPWYPTLRIFRQPRPHDWPATLEAVAARLERMTLA